LRADEIYAAKLYSVLLLKLLMCDVTSGTLLPWRVREREPIMGVCSGYSRRFAVRDSFQMCT